MRRERGSGRAIVQQRGGGVVRNRHASMPTRTSGGGRWGGRGRPGTGNCPAAGTRADGRGHNGLGRTRQRRVRGRGSHRPAARASADRASEPPGGNRRPSRDSAALARSRRRRCRRQGSWMDGRPGADRAAGTGPGISPPGRLATVRPEETMNIIVRF